MKRSTIVALIAGLVAGAIVIVLHALRITLPVEEALARAITGGQAPAHAIGVKTQYVLVLLLSLGTAWLVMQSQRRTRLLVPVALFFVELLAIAWVALLFQTFFQPLPSLLAVGFSFAAVAGYSSFTGKSKSGVANELFRGRVSEEKLAHIASGNVAYTPEPRSYDVTAVVCDIANKYDLTDDGPPEMIADVTNKFIQYATESLVKAGAYVDTITGEGIVAIFGFPGEDSGQAEKATRHALELLESFDRLSGNDEGGLFSKFGVHLGISSGSMVFAPLQQNDGRALFSTGEPVELARRFCIANRFYGSRILIGPGTFELASKGVVARPIDFLSGVDARERHEIYEPLLLADNATPEQLARRDSFWNGVVLYREKRWAEAYTQFQKARGPGDEDDQPLQLYLRRLEPLALHLVEAD